MIQIFTGLPRSGKTYRAVKYINDNFVNYKNSEYNKFHYLYTNIGGFKFDEINNDLKDFPLVVNDESFVKVCFPLNWDTIYKHINKLYDMAQDDKDDEDLIKYMTYHKMNNSLFVIDECYRYFTKKSDPVLVWFLAYHGHLSTDIILILQNKSLIHSDYKAFTEFFIDAQPKSKSLRKNQLRYYHYASDSYTKEQRHSSDSIIAKDEIFKLYKSGDKHQPKQIIYKYFGLMFIAVIAIFVFIKLLMSNMEERYDVDESVNTSQTYNYNKPPVLDSNDTLMDYSHYDLLSVRCSTNSCWNLDTTYENTRMSLTMFKYLITKYNFVLQFSEVKNEIYKLVQKEKYQEKKTLVQLIDYHYLIPPDSKKNLLSTLFKKRVIEKKKTSILSASPLNTDNKKRLE